MNRSGQLLLYSGLLVHYASALYALWQRWILRPSASETSQLVLGFAIPLLLVLYVVIARISDSFFRLDPGYYAYLPWVISFVRPIKARCRCWSWSSSGGHAMVGLPLWLRVRPCLPSGWGVMRPDRDAVAPLV